MLNLNPRAEMVLVFDVCCNSNSLLYTKLVVYTEGTFQLKVFQSEAFSLCHQTSQKLSHPHSVILLASLYFQSKGLFYFFLEHVR